jgi:26S proteasome regulatory subunit N5
VCESIARACWAAKDVPALTAQVLALCKRRGQAKAAITALVRVALGFATQTAAPLARSEREDLIGALKTVTDGKIYVEVERARATAALADLLEADGRIADASEELQTVAVETFGSMERMEKAEFLIEQVSGGGQGMGRRA